MRPKENRSLRKFVSPTRSLHLLGVTFFADKYETITRRTKKFITCGDCINLGYSIDQKSGKRVWKCFHKETTKLLRENGVSNIIDSYTKSILECCPLVTSELKQRLITCAIYHLNNVEMKKNKHIDRKLRELSNRKLENSNNSSAESEEVDDSLEEYDELNEQIEKIKRTPKHFHRND